MNHSDSLRQTLERIHTLPAIPQVAREILALRIVSYADEQALLALVEKDPAISARVIGLANSPLFGASRKITALGGAVALLGIRRVKMMALSFAMMTSMGRTTSGLLNVDKLWQHSLTVTLLMQTLLGYMDPATRPPPDETFLAGLLHDIGFLVLDHIDPMLSDKFHASLAAEAERSVEEVEVGVLAMSHSDLGAELVRHWGLPDNLIAVLRYHHRSDDAQAALGQPLVNMVCLAEKLLPTFGCLEPAQPDIAPADWLALGIDPGHAGAISAAAQQHARDMTAPCT